MNSGGGAPLPNDDGVPFSSNGIGAMVNRMQERNLQLASERALRDVRQSQLDALQEDLQQLTSQTNNVRRKHLSVVRTRHGVELELWRMRDQHEERVKETKMAVQRAQEVSQATAAMEATWKRSIQELYAPHDVEQEIYRRALDKTIRARQTIAKRREQKLNFFRNRATELPSSDLDTEEDTETRQKDVERLDRKEEAEDEEVASIAMQIKATLAKR
jgi:hypothetical protein